MPGDVNAINAIKEKLLQQKFYILFSCFNKTIGTKLNYLLVF